MAYGLEDFGPHIKKLMDEQSAIEFLMESVLDGEFRLVMMFKHNGVPYAQGTTDTIANVLDDRKIHLDNRVMALAESFWRRVRLNLNEA